jgi:hypothetical protein
MLLAGMLAAALSSGPALAGGSIKDLDKKNGFRDVALAQSCERIEGIKGNTGAVKAAVKQGMGAGDKARPYLGMLQYSRATDDLTIGRSELLTIGYTCYAEQLMSVRLEAFGKANGEPLLAALVEAYGDATVADPDTQRWVWEGKKVILTFQRDAIHELVTVVYASKPMLDAKAQDDLALEQAAINDL